MMKKQKNIPFVLERNGKQYKIIALTETNGPSMTGPNIEVKSCVAMWLYKGVWHPVKNYEIRATLREIYDSL
ncbi:hypothetical protein [Caproiciproducens sp. NJN-50]|uniref:hypothetical protein n=1 Tax=Caproiciproducens sp. NJN-50 TaxID=2507162 RepID=UPI0013E8DF8C|nr:hypothetical protein [Caproiciproducens sp. NJN-50]